MLLSEIQCGAGISDSPLKMKTFRHFNRFLNAATLEVELGVGGSCTAPREDGEII